MNKIKAMTAAILCSCLLFNIKIANAENIKDLPNTVVYLTGKGIATRLHEPILKECQNINTKFVRVADDLTNENTYNECFEGWLFLGTPVYKHKQNIIGSAGQYKKILCEKPVGLSLDEISQIKDIITKNKILFRVNYALRFLPVLEEIREFINSEKVKSITFTCKSNFNKGMPNKAWKSDYRLGGGIIYSILPHLIDVLNFIGCEYDLNNISFESTSKVPMNDIKLYSKTNNGVNTTVDIDLCENFDEFTLKIETEDQMKVFDLINSVKDMTVGNRYPNGTLSATSEISPWRISFRYLLESLFKNPEDYRFAKIEDAENVHKVLDVILLKSQN